MKKFIGLVVIVAALVLGGYYGMGLITERTLKRNVDIINQSNGLFVDIEQYNRGWFTSSALINWRLHIPERVVKDQNGQSTTIAAQDHRIQMPLTIYHGPVIIAGSTVKFGLGYAHSDLALPPEYAAKFSTLFTSESTQPKLRLSLFVNYMNNSRLHMGLPEFKLIAKQGGDSFEWFGMDSDISISSNLKNIDGSITVDGASLLKNKIKAMLSKINSNYELHQTATGLYLGEANLSVPSVVVSESAQKIFELEQFSAHSSSDIEGNLFGSYFKTSLDKLIARDKTYGPALLEMSIKNLDAQVLANINEQVNKMQQGADAERQQALFMLIPQLPKLFGQGAQFEVSKLSFVMPEGTVEGDLLISLPKGDTANPFQLLQKVQGHGKLKVPAPVVKELVMMSVKQKLIISPNLQQSAVQQKQNADSSQAVDSTQVAQTTGVGSSAPTAPAKPAIEKPVVPGQAAAPVIPTQTTQEPLTVADIDKQAQIQTEQKLSTLLQNGVLSLQGNDYVVEVSLQQGQLTVNGKPFTSAMLQF